MIPLPPLYLLHPVAVHFPIALLTVGWVAAEIAAYRNRPQWLSDATSWILWLGTAAAWVAVGLGLLAEDKVPHVPSAWRTMETHETLAFWAAGSFTVLSLWRWRMGREHERLFLFLWLAAMCALLATGYYGGGLVFTYGVGFQK